MIKVLLLGSNGFIGRHLKEFLSNKYTIFSPSSKELNLLEEYSLKDFLQKNKVDIIINSCNRGGTRDKAFLTDIVQYNLRIFFNIQKFSSKVAKIIHFGSGAEYAKHKDINFVKEEDINAIPLDDYGFYKYISNEFIEKEKNIFNLRLFGCYGEYEDYRLRFISNSLIKNILKLPIVINKNVKFSYIYIRDVCNIVSYFLDNEPKHKVYNIAHSKTLDLLEISNIINEIGDFKSEIKVLNEGFANEYTCSNERLLREIPNLNLSSHKESISKLRAYFISVLDTIDKDLIIQDPYLKFCNELWNKK